MSEEKNVTTVDWQETALQEFKPLPAQLQEMSAEASKFTIEDFKDKEKFELGHKVRMQLRDARIQLQKIGKALRADAVEFQRRVIQKEKELVGIIEPEEKRLKELEEQAKIEKEREKRKEMLPARKERIKALMPEGVPNPYIKTDDELLDMDAQAFEAYITECKQDILDKERERLEEERRKKEEEEERRRQEEQKRLEEERRKLEEEKRKIEEEKRRVEAEKEAQRRAEEARIKAEQEAKAKAEREKAEAEAEKARIEAEKKREAERLAKREEWQKFLAEHGYTEETKDQFIIRQSDTEYILYKRVGAFKK